MMKLDSNWKTERGSTIQPSKMQRTSY